MLPGVVAAVAPDRQAEVESIFFELRREMQRPNSSHVAEQAQRGAALLVDIQQRS